MLVFVLQRLAQLRDRGFGFWSNASQGAGRIEADIRVLILERVNQVVDGGPGLRPETPQRQRSFDSNIRVRVLQPLTPLGDGLAVVHRFFRTSRHEYETDQRA